MMSRVAAAARLGALLFTLGGAIGADMAAAQETSLTVRHVGQDTLEVQAGARGGTAIQVTNPPGAPFARVEVAVDLPEGWRGIGFPVALELPPDTSAVRIAGFLPPEGAPSGIYLLRFSVRAAAGTRAPGFDSVFVRIAEEVRLEISVDGASGWTTAGESYLVRFLVTNHGNTPSQVELALESAAGFPVIADTTPRWMLPGATVVVEAEVSTPAGLPRALTHILRLRATSPADTAEGVSRMDVVPQGRRTLAAGSGPVGEIRLRISEDGRSSPVRIQAGGPLTPGSATRMNLLIQSPAQQRFAGADIYRFGLESPRYTLQLGDRVYSLSSLTEPGRMGVGAAAAVRGGPLEIGAWTQRNRRSPWVDMQHAAHARLRVGRPVALRVNWLRSEDREGGREIWSAEATLNAAGWFRLDGEYGMRAGSSAEARSAHLRAGRGPLTLNLRHVRADSAYGGAYGGSDIDGGYLALRPWRAVVVEAALEDHHMERSVLGAVHRSSLRTARVGFGYGSVFSLKALARERSHAFGNGILNRGSQSVHVRLGLPLGRLSLRPAFEGGVSVGAPGTVREPFWRGMLEAAFSGGSGSITSSLEYFSGSTPYHVGATEGLIASGSASFGLGGRTDLSLSVHHRRYWGDQDRASLSVSAALEQELAFGHRLTGRALIRSSTGVLPGGETLLTLTYSIPFNLPTARRANTGSVIVRIFDVETGAPLPRVVLSLDGERTATDGGGYIRFNDLAPGTHYLALDRGSAGIDRVPVVELPLVFDLATGERREFEVGMNRSANMTVRVEAAPLSAPGGRATGTGTETRGVRGAVVEFSRGSERFRRVTDDRGVFEAGDLRPGSWDIAIVSASLPAHHEFERGAVTVALTPGERSEIRFLARSLERPVRFVAAAELSEAPRDGSATALPEPETDGAPRSVPMTDVTPPRTPASVVTENVPAPARLSDGGYIYQVPESVTTLMEVARRLYLQTELWVKIWRANLELIPDPMDVPPGIRLEIPPRAPLSQEDYRALQEFRISGWRTVP